MAIELAEPTRAEWLASRKGGIGSSDIAALVGADPYRTPLDVWLDKTGRGADGIETRPMRLGKKLEPVILSEYEHETGRLARLNSLLHVHPALEIAVATPDAFEVESRDGIEMKAPGLRQAKRWGPSGSDEVPEQYLAQCAWQMAVTGRDRWHLAALLGGQEFRVYRIERDRELEEGLLEAAARFWRDHVVVDRAPALDASEAARRYVERLFPANRGAIREATSEEIATALELAGVRHGIAGLETEKERLGNELRAVIGDADGIEARGSFRLTWKCNKPSKKVDWEAVARSLGAAPTDIEPHTKTVPGPRVFRPSGPAFEKEKEE